MPPDSRSFVALSRPWRALVRHILPLRPSPSYAHNTPRQYSSIADAMLGRANKSFEAAKPKPDLAKQLFPSSSPVADPKIDQQFKKVRQSSQSIGGFTNYTNVSNPLRAKSPNIRKPMTKQNSTISASSIASHSAPSIFSRQDSFQNTPDTIDLTQDGYVGAKHTASQGLPVDFDLNDFEDDADIDLDLDFELPMSMSMPPPPTKNKTMSPSLPTLKCANPPSSQNIPSSAQTWSSSSPSHMVTPPGALKRRREQELERETTSRTAKSGQDTRPPAKRRSLPWMEKKATADQIALSQEEEEEDLEGSSLPQVRCLTCREIGHNASQCRKKSKENRGSAYFFEPKETPKSEKRVPWNSTASAVAEARQRHKQSRKSANTSTEAKKTSKLAMAPVTLSEEQRNVLELVTNQQKSVFFTGSAGTGKSVLMRSIITELRKKHVREPDRVAVTASTGLAACNIGGITLHSFGGIGLGKEDVPTLVKKIKRNQKAKNRWMRTKVLIIDEISMVDGDLFDKLEGIARAIRGNGRPFGGIQLVITGDFFQLPPVPDYDKKGQVKFAFDAGTWATAIHHTIGLTEVFRQKDPVFANMLNEMRLGKITNDTIAAFKRLSRKLDYSSLATELFPTRNEVDNANSYRMRDLIGKPYNFPAKDEGQLDESIREKLLSNMMACKHLELKKGAQVMLIKNMDDGLVNGSLGKVIAFMDEKIFDLYTNEADFEDIIDTNIPVEDLSDEGRKARNYILSKENAGQPFPLVQFTLPDGTHRIILVTPEEWKIELPNGEVQAKRTQLPLILAWALSIHKAQGQTLERVKIDLKKIFEKGQAYVALSRATSQAGLEVQNFDKSKVMAHPRVASFYNSLYSVNKALEHPRVAKPPPPKRAKTYEEEFMEAQASHINGHDFDEEESLMAMAAHC